MRLENGGPGDIAVSHHCVTVEIHQIGVEQLEQCQNLRFREQIPLKRIRVDPFAKYFNEVDHELGSYTAGTETAAAGRFDSDTIARL